MFVVLTDTTVVARRPPARLAVFSLLKPNAGTISQAVQPAIHDVTDSSAMRSWFNTPLSSSLEVDIYKATNIVRAFARVGNNPPERHIPTHILKDAAGFAILSTVKVSCTADALYCP